MKKNSGSALTSVIVVFLLVTMIGVPLLSMVVYNYRFREYDSGIKEAEYKNEVIMDRIATIIKNEVISAISEAKNSSTLDITSITDTLVNSYNSVYDEAYEDFLKGNAEYDASGNLTNNTDGIEGNDIEDIVPEKMKEIFADKMPTYEGVDVADVIGILDFEGDITSAKINDENLQKVCNSIFQKKYQDALLSRGTPESPISNIFDEIYRVEYEDLAVNPNLACGDEELIVDTDTGRTKGPSIRVRSKYDYYDKTFHKIYTKDGWENGISAEFKDGELKIGIESNYKSEPSLPLTTLSATFVIGTPDFNAISAIEQQTIALSNPVLDYGLIVGDTLTIINSDVNVDGNSLVRANGDTSDTTTGMIINSGATFKAQKVGTNEGSKGRIATSGDIIMKPGSSLISGENPIYYRNLYLGAPNENSVDDSKISVTFNGDVFAKDDLEINSKVANVTQKQGSYFGFNDTNDEGPDSSSAIVVNSSELDNIEIKLGDLYLDGRAFIDGVRSRERKDVKTNEPLVYKTGESISIKGNYTAYQTPLFGTTGNTYDAYNLELFPYLFEGATWIEGMTNRDTRFYDAFVGQIKEDTSSEDKEKIFQEFDKEHKWQFFREYFEQYKNIIKKVKISASAIKYIKGVGIMWNGGANEPTLISQETLNLADGETISGTSATLISKRKRYEEFAECFGYYPDGVADEDRVKELSKWLKLDSHQNEATFEANDDIYYTYISSTNAGNKSLAWGTSAQNKGEDIFITVADESTPINGLIIHDGDLTITSNCNSNIPFIGTIIVTGNLIINGNVTIIGDKEATSELIIQNYVGASGYSGDVGVEGNTSNLGEGSLFGAFEYDGSGTTYVAINVDPRSNMIDINELVGITDWKKQGYGRL